MQVNTNNIQRPILIEPFLNEEFTYIDCTTNSSNTVHKNNGVTSNSHNIKSSLKNEYLRAINNELIMGCPASGLYIPSNFFFVHSKNKAIIFINSECSYFEEYYKIANEFDVFSSYRNHLSLQTA